MASETQAWRKAVAAKTAERDMMLLEHGRLYEGGQE